MESPINNAMATGAVAALPLGGGGLTNVGGGPLWGWWCWCWWYWGPLLRPCGSDGCESGSGGWEPGSPGPTPCRGSVNSTCHPRQRWGTGPSGGRGRALGASDLEVAERTRAISSFRLGQEEMPAAHWPPPGGPVGRGRRCRRVFHIRVCTGSITSPASGNVVGNPSRCVEPRTCP